MLSTDTNAIPASPIAEIISIGDEMTSGARLDTNSQWLSRELGKLGFRVLFHTTVGDSLEACVDVFQHAMRRASLVVTTGGLGPTADDLTRQAIADATGRPLQMDPSSLEHIEQIFAYRGREMPPQNRIQAMFPEGCCIVPNPHGTAPGIDLSIDTPACRMIALPGVPAEMQEMWYTSIAPSLSNDRDSRMAIAQAVIKCFGLGESEMESRLGGMIARDHSPRVGITVSRATISLRIEAIASSRAAALEQIEATRREIFDRVGEFIFGEGEEFELEDAVTSRLRQRGEKLAIIEHGHDSILASLFARAQAGDCVTHCIHFPTPPAFDKINMDADESLDALLHVLLANRRHAPDWLLQINAYPDAKAQQQDASARQDSARQDSAITKGKRPTPSPIEFTISRLSPASPVESAALDETYRVVHHATETIGGHWEIVSARIAKTGMQKLLQCLVGHE